MLLLAILLAAAGPPGEDAEHRADRLRTEQLNRAVQADVARRPAADGSALRRYEAERVRYAAALAAWRRRVAACEQGDYDACDDRER